eukprot:2507365-Rhodomonas_salina.2
MNPAAETRLSDRSPPVRAPARRGLGAPVHARQYYCHGQCELEYLCADCAVCLPQCQLVLRAGGLLSDEDDTAVFTDLLRRLPSRPTPVLNSNYCRGDRFNSRQKRKPFSALLNRALACGTTRPLAVKKLAIHTQDLPVTRRHCPCL